MTIDFQINNFIKGRLHKRQTRRFAFKNEDLITSETFEPNLTGFKNLSGLVSGFIEFSFLTICDINRFM